jgi:endonuclease/exonuclease/phosphatase family metal-dependent hydrolase
MIVAFGLALVYQLAYDRELGFPNRFLLSASALVILGLAFSARMRSVVAIPPRGHLLTLWPLAMLAVPGALWLADRGDDPALVPPPGELRVATYNLHLGVRVDDGRVDLEAFARTIEGLDADVLVLQEVGRGWPVNGMTDVAEWLSARLDVPYVYAPAADGQMGNAIATRLPVVAASSGELPQAGGLMVRSYLSVTLALDTGEIRVVGTHLQHRDQDVDSRLAQIDVLLDALGQADGTVLAGDMNAEPGSQEIDRLEAFGFTSSQEALGTDVATSWRDDTLIDFVFAGPGVTVTGGEVVEDARASDHLPVTATVGLA